MDAVQPVFESSAVAEVYFRELFQSGREEAVRKAVHKADIRIAALTVAVEHNPSLGDELKAVKNDRLTLMRLV